VGPLDDREVRTPTAIPGANGLWDRYSGGRPRRGASNGPWDR